MIVTSVFKIFNMQYTFILTITIKGTCSLPTIFKISDLIVKWIRKGQFHFIFGTTET
jgi:hypothetical protein